jgi:hypothetical protein
MRKQKSGKQRVLLYFFALIYLASFLGRKSVKDAPLALSIFFDVPLGNFLGVKKKKKRFITALSIFVIFTL